MSNFYSPIARLLHFRPYVVLTSILLVLLFTTKLSATEFNVLEFDAIPDGKTLCTTALQRAIDSASNRGGELRFPAGKYLTGTLYLRSNLHIHLEPGAIILGSADIKDYHPEFKHLLYGFQIENFSIGGTGKIDGQGPYFADQNDKWRPKDRPDPWILIEQSNKIRFADITLENSPAVTTYFKTCDFVNIRGITIDNDFRIWNTDGIDIGDTRNVTISDCFLRSGDDLICLKSKERYVENVTVTNCILSGDDGGLKLGTGSRIGVRNCTFSNIAIYNTRFAIAVFLIDGGKHEHVMFDNITIETGSRHATEYPIFVDIHKRDSSRNLGYLRDFTFRNIAITTRGNLLIAGQPDHCLEDLYMDNISVTIKGLADLSDLDRKPTGNRFTQRLRTLDDFSRVSSHITIANVKGLRINNIRIRHDYDGPGEDRHALWLRNVERGRISEFSGRQAIANSVLPAVWIEDSDNMIFTKMELQGTSKSWYKALRSKGIVWKKNP
jgi:Glycosyl hydrolases family 28